MTRLRLLLTVASALASCAGLAAAQMPSAVNPQSPADLLQAAESRIDIGESRDAQDAIQSVIDQINATDEPDTELLIEAWTQLGNAYAADGLIPLSLAAFETASDISRRHYGLFNENLVEILLLMDQTARASGDFTAAADFAREADRVVRHIRENAVRDVEKTFGVSSSEHLNAKMVYASWLATYDEDLARITYNEALDLIDDHFDNDIELRARTFQAMGENIGTYFIYYGVSHEPYELIRARRLIKRAADPSPLLHASIMRDIGDWRLKSNSGSLRRRASRAYREAWLILDDAEDGAALQDLFFGQPELIQRGMAPMSRARNLTNSPDATQGTVDLEFGVDASGRVRDVTVLNADPDWMSADAVRQLRYSIFRPSIRDGELVASEGRLAFSFRYTETLARNLE